MRKNSKNNFGFTLAELAATLGVFALAATILTPAFSGVPAISNSNVTVSSDSPAGASPFTPPVNAILVDVTNTATGVSTQKVVSDPSATSTTISGLDPQGTYTVEVAKQNQAGKSPAVVAEVSYVKTGEVQVNYTVPVTVTDTSKPIYQNGAAKYRNGAAIYTNGAATAWEQKIASYGTKTISVNAYIQRTTTPVYVTVQRSRQVRVAPYERYHAASSYSYSCTKYRTVQVRCGSTSYQYSCGTESYSYSCTKSRTKYCTGRECYGTGSKRVCENYSYACGTESYSSTCTGTRTKYCTGYDPKYCSEQEAYSSTCTGTNPAWTETLYNYNTEYYNETVQDGTTTSTDPAREGTCAANGTVGSWTGVSYGCTDTSMNKTVTDYNKPNYVNGAAIYVENPNDPIKVNGAATAWEDKQEARQRDVTVDVFGSKLVEKTVKAEAGQLLLNANSVQTVKGVWKSATVAAKGAGTNQTVGSRVNFTTAKLVTLNGTQYLVVDARAAR